MNNESIQKRIKNIKLGYIIHIIINIVLIIIQFLIFFKVFWIIKKEKNIFYIDIFVNIFFTVIPIILILLISILEHTKRFLIFLESFLLALFYIVFLNGIIISVNLWNNAQNLSTFFTHCPYNFNEKDIPRIFSNFSIENKDTIENQCKSNRCFLNSYYKNSEANYYVYNYICNIRQQSKYIKCTKLNSYDISLRNNIFNFVDFCKDYKTIYYCAKVDGYLLYNLPYYFKCPDKSDVNINYVLIFIAIIIYSMIESIPWVIENFYIDDYIKLLFRDNYNNNHNINNSLTETNNTSKVDDNNNSNRNNQGDNNQSFRKEPTRTIIIDNYMDKDNNNDINDNINIRNNDMNNNLTIENNDILNINNKQITNKNILILSNKTINNKDNKDQKSSSQNILINNYNQNIFKIINNKNK